MLDDTEKAQIVACYIRGTTPKAIASVLGRKVGTIRSYYSRFLLNYGLPPKVIVSKSKWTARLTVSIKKLAREQPMLGTRSYEGFLQNELGEDAWIPHFTNIARFLRKNGYKRKNYCLKPFLNEANRVKRLRFANEWVSEDAEGLSKLGTVVWTDESMFRSDPFTRKQSGWVPSNTPTPYQAKIASGGISVMFHGSISHAGVGPLIEVIGTMDNDQVKKIYKEDVFPYVQELEASLGGDVRVMHDNAPCHREKTVRDLIDATGFDFIDWPPYSPDLNPIENIWAYIKWKLYSFYPPSKTRDELIDRVFAIWADITPELCARYCGKYNKRLIACLNANGWQTKY